MVRRMDTRISGGRRRSWRLGRGPEDPPPAPPDMDLAELCRGVVEEVPALAPLPPLERRLRVAAVADRALGPDTGTGTRAGRLLEAVDDLAGLGPLESLLADAAVTEIMVSAPDEVYVELEGRLQRSPVRFRDGGHL